MQDRAAPSRPALARRGTRPGAAAAGPDARAEALVQRRMQGQADGSAPVRRIAALQGMADAGGGAGVVQAVFAPVTATHKTHLRQNGVWGTHVPGAIAAGDEIVADKADRQNQTKSRLIGGDKVTVWTKAVNVAGRNWVGANHGGANTYIRDSRLGQDKTYPFPAPEAKPAGRSRVHPQARWTFEAGEFADVEESVSHPGERIVRKAGAFRRLTAGNALAALDADESRQVDLASLEAHVIDRTRNILTTAAAGHAWSGELAKLDNIKKLVITEKGGSKALRWDEVIWLESDAFVNWFRWLSGPFDRIRDGAAHVVSSLVHWRRYLNPPNGDGVFINGIDFTGSDLHDEGLGAMFVNFAKPAAEGPAPYTAFGNIDVVIKPEERDIERALFGDQPGSLARRVNTMAALGPNEAIRTFNIVTRQGYGSLIQKITDAKALDASGQGTRPATPAMREALMFAMLTGLSDLHYENMLWTDAGIPYFIDADNALNRGRLEFDIMAGLRLQKGFSSYNRAETDDIVTKLETDRRFQSKILGALLENDPTKVMPVLRAVSETFAGKSGRAVPLFTQAWANELKEYIKLPDGQRGDKGTDTRWGIAWGKSKEVAMNGNLGPGFEGETGMPAGGGAYFRNVEMDQIKADFDRGQIPFYTYQFDSGLVRHNNQIVWHGRPLAETMNNIFAKYAHQPR